MAHVGPGVEGLDEAGQVDRPLAPAEVLHALAHPDLEGPGGDGRSVLDHRSPPLVTLEDLAADVRDRADSDAEDDEVEVAGDAQAPGADLAAVPVRFEVPLLGLQGRAVPQLLPARLRRPAGQAVDVDQRVVAAGALLDPCLDVELERFDVGLLARGQLVGRRQPHVLETVEEPELDPAPLEHLVERREDHVAHPGAHLPEQRPAVGEEHAHGAAQRLPRRHPGPGAVAVLVGEDQVVDAPHEGRVEGSP